MVHLRMFNHRVFTLFVVLIVIIVLANHVTEVKSLKKLKILKKVKSVLPFLLAMKPKKKIVIVPLPIPLVKMDLNLKEMRGEMRGRMKNFLSSLKRTLSMPFNSLNSLNQMAPMNMMEMMVMMDCMEMNKHLMNMETWNMPSPGRGGGNTNPPIYSEQKPLPQIQHHNNNNVPAKIHERPHRPPVVQCKEANCRQNPNYGYVPTNDGKTNYNNRDRDQQDTRQRKEMEGGMRYTGTYRVSGHYVPFKGLKQIKQDPNTY